MADQEKLQIARDPELERARTWWRENGRPIIVGVAVGLAAVGGFNYWQHHQETRAENASVLFERLRTVIEQEAEAKAQAEAAREAEAENEAASEAGGDDETEAADGTISDESDAADEVADDAESEAATTIERIAVELMSDYSATPYATHAAFALAKHRADNGDLDRAAAALQWILDHGEDGLRHVARLRLAAVLLSQDKADAAVAQLDVEDIIGFADRYYELFGDAHLQKGDVAAARGAYQRSLDALAPGDAGRALIQLKLDDLGE